MSTEQKQAAFANAFGQRMEQLKAKIKAKIDEVGWYVIGVFPTKDQPISPFTYSVGFTAMDHPELIIYGLSPELAQDLIGDMYERVKNGERFEDGDEIEELIQEPYKMVCKAVPGDGRPANMTRNIYQGPISLLQLVWPDQDNNFPWDEGYDTKIDQPVLALQPDHPDLHERDPDEHTEHHHADGCAICDALKADENPGD